MIQLSVSESRLHYHHPVPGESWSIAIGEILLIAEYTTADGPKSDDYFLVFVTLEQGELYHSNATMYAAGIDESLTALETILGCSLDLRLQASTTWNSRVLWPPNLAGSPYFSYEEVIPEGFWAQLRSRVKGRRMESRVADPICDYLKTHIAPQMSQEP